MKLRLKGNSLRLRVTPSELQRLHLGERIQEEIVFSSDPEARLKYILEVGSHSPPVQVSFASPEIVVSISQDQMTSWSGEHQVGIYVSLPLAEEKALEVSIEKDFACLDLTDKENEDTFANPLAGKAC